LDGACAERIERCDERLVVAAPLVPPAETGRQDRADEGLVDRRVVADPRIAVGKGGGVLGEAVRKPRVTDANQVVGNAEVEQVRDRLEAFRAEAIQRAIGPFPVEAPGSAVDHVIWDAVAQKTHAEVPDEGEVLGISVPVPRLPQLVLAQLADHGRRAFDAGRHHEPPIGFRADGLLHKCLL
jgi:hypothetical protein